MPLTLEAQTATSEPDDFSESSLMARAPLVMKIPAEQYHAGPGVSKSLLDWAMKSPALVPWSRNAPKDEEADTAVDFGQALHCLLLEPNAFERRYVQEYKKEAHVLSSVDDIKAALDEIGANYKASMKKADLVALLLYHNPNAPVSERLAEEWARGLNGRTVLTHEEQRKLFLMRDSVMAHPTARLWLEAEGETERSHYWIDQDTGLLCRCRPDKEILSHRYMLDLKSTSKIDRCGDEAIRYGYLRQAVHYRDGWEATQGVKLDRFAFIFISSQRSAGRFEVRMFEPQQQDLDNARLELSAAKQVYAEAKKNDSWHDIETLTVPISWA
jgi:exodeoxyribonuclease VIII